MPPWLVEILTRQGQQDQARALFERLLALRNDVGLLAEDGDPIAGRQPGNFPQAIAHLALVGAALALGEQRRLRPPEERLPPTGPTSDAQPPVRGRLS